MKYKALELRSPSAQTIATEIMFEVASARASGIELLRLTISNEDEKLKNKLYFAAIRVLRSMKGRGAIQFFATSEAFADSTTEAKFLSNKYPELAEEFHAAGKDNSVIFMRI